MNSKPGLSSELPSSPGETPVKPTVSPDEELSKECMTLLSELDSSTWLQTFARSLFSEKTLPLDGMLPGLGGDLAHASDPLAIVRSRLRSGRVALAHSTDGKGCSCSGLGPTVLVGDATGGRTSKGAERPDEGGASVQAKRGLLPTLRASEDRSPGPEGGRADSATSLGKRGLLPTLSATPYGSNQGGSDASDPKGWSRSGKKRPSLQTMNKGPLNPMWCEAYFAFPPRWTDPADSQTAQGAWLAWGIPSRL